MAKPADIAGPSAATDPTAERTRGRRGFLTHAAAAAVALPLLSRTRALAAAAPASPPNGPAAAPAPKVLVDWHNHWISNAEAKYLASRSTPPRLVTGADGVARLENAATASFAASTNPGPFSPSDIEARLRNLDANGVGRQVLSQTVAMGFDATVPLEDLKTLFRAFNDELAGVIRAHPTRFLAVAALPSGDPAWAAQELRRAQEELGFIGGSLPLNAFASLEGARTLAPLFAEAQKLKSHFFVHRAPASPRVPGQPPIVLPTDTDRIRWGLISNTHLAAGAITLGLTDFLDPYPDVSVEIIMLGGFTPYLISSWELAADAGAVKNPVERLRRIYFDPGPYSVNGEWVRLAADKIGADRILFGTDYGVGGGARGDVGPAIATLDRALTPEQRQLIYVDNSRKLLRAKGRTDI